MLSVGLDLHERYSQLEVVGDAGVRRVSARLPNERSMYGWRERA